MGKIILGYVCFILYQLLLIIGGESFSKKTSVPKETIRKVQHLFTSGLWILGVVFFGPSIHMVIINFFGLLLLTIGTFTGIFTSSERSDSKYSYGLMYFGLGSFLVLLFGVYVERDLFLLTGIPYFCMVIADGFAPIISKLFKNHNFYILENKSIVGTMTVFVFSFVIVLLFNIILKLNYNILFILAVASISSMLELFGKKGIDNLFIELGVFLLIILNYYQLLTPVLLIALALSPIVICVSIVKKSLTPLASIISCLFVFSITFFGGESMYILSVSLFAINEIISKLTKKHSFDNVEEKKPRNAIQILCVSFVPFILTLIYYLTNKEMFLYIGYILIIEQFADTIASTIGVLSKYNPVDIIRFKRVERGISGGVSLIGSISALLATIVSTFIIIYYIEFKLYLILTIVIISFIGTILDSVVGSLFQSSYLCNICNKQKEESICCGSDATLIKGYRIINNSMVNFITGILCVIVGIIVFNFIILL